MLVEVRQFNLGLICDRAEKERHFVPNEML